MFEVFRYTARSLLEHPQMTNGLFSQLRFARGGNPRMNPDFQITIQVLIRIELGRVGGQVEHLDLLRVFFQPLVYQFAVMHSQIVDDQKHLAIYILDQPTQKSNQRLGVHGIPVDHEPDLSLIGDRRDQIDPLGLGRQADSRSLAAGSVAAAVVAAVAQPGLVGPVNLSILMFGAFDDRRISLLQPLLDHFGVLLVSAPIGLLRSKPPAFQVFPNGPDGHAHSPQLFDQLLHRNPRPQGERQFQLIGLLVADQPLKLLLLLYGQLPASSSRPTAFANTDTFDPTVLVQLAPSVDRAGIHLEHLSDVLNTVAFFAKLNSLLSQLLLDFGFECACIYFFHAHAISYRFVFVYNYLPG